MTVFDAHQRRPGEPLRARDISAFIEAARRTSHISVADGYMANVLSGGMTFAPQPLADYGGWETGLTVQGFIAKIVDKGPVPPPPEGEPPQDPPPEPPPDYEDARYWVQELFESSKADSTIAEGVSFIAEAIPPADEVEAEAKYPVRHTTATNLSEWSTEPKNQTHLLNTGGDTIVRVGMLQTFDGVAKFYFTRDVSTAIKWVVVRPIAPADVDKNWIKVQEVRPKLPEPEPEPEPEKGRGTWEGEWETVGNEIDVLVYPNQRAGEFEAYVWPAGVTVNDQANILPVVRVGAHYWLWQYIPYNLERLPENMAFGDCRPPAGGA